MSLMDEMKNVVDTGRELLSTVSGKMQQIDDRVEDAEKEFDKFTTVDFPLRVQNALQIEVYVSMSSGEDDNVGTSSSNALRTMSGVKKLLDNNLYRNVTLRLECGGTYVIEDDGIIAAAETIKIEPYGTGDAPILKQGFSSTGAPTRNIFSAPYVQFNGFSTNQIIVETATFQNGHSWDDWESRYSGSSSNIRLFTALQGVKKIKCRYTTLRIGDAPFASIYAGASASDDSSYELIMATGTNIETRTAGGSSANFFNDPYFLTITGDSRLPFDMIVTYITLKGYDAFFDTIRGLSTDNVRSNIAI